MDLITGAGFPLTDTDVYKEHLLTYIRILNVPFLSLEPMCQRNIFICMLSILMSNKDLFDLI